MRVLSVASECFPYIKTGGLADVVGALPAPLAAEGIEVTTLIPGYRGLELPDDGSVIAANLPQLFDRDGSPYQDPTGTDWVDNLQRFNLFSRYAARIALGLGNLPRFDLVHAHDWQSAAVIAHLDQLSHAQGVPRPATLFTIHNLAFQGRFGFPELGSEARAELQLFDLYFGANWLEYWGDINLLKSALLHADHVTTVSPTYAAEITTPAFGEGLDGVLRHRGTELSGILNGLNTAVWDPNNDPHLVRSYSARTRVKGKAANKAALQTEMGLAVDSDRPLFGLVTRLSDQKGIDLILSNVDALVQLGGQLVVLGSGDKAMEAELTRASASYPGAVAVHLGYSEAIAHQIHAASDFLLVPSRFEPCGLTQLSAQVYGALPIVSPVGGLRDTVIHTSPAAELLGSASGLIMREVSAGALAESLADAVSLYSDPVRFGSVQKTAMKLGASFGWDQPAAAYASLYKDLVAKRT